MSSPSPTDPDSDRALALVHQGWNHLQLQRPLAAWAAWHRALRLIPDHPAASQALAALESAAELPASARSVYRFQAPSDPDRRARWDARFQGRNLEELTDATDVFASLIADDPADAAAWFNHALCLAWQGRNAEAIASLDRVVRLQAGDDFERAVNTWTLAEVLRQGAGAERLADDLRYAWVLESPGADAPRPPDDLPVLLPVATPNDPITGKPQVAEVEVFEWLDRPLPENAHDIRSGADLPRLLATVVRTPHSLRLSSPDPETLDGLRDRLFEWIGHFPPSFRREAIPLPLLLCDAAVWTFRPPRGIDEEARRSLARAAVEHYYEDLWIHQPRHGLDDRSPLEASRLARAGDLAMRARLTAVIRFRKQLGARLRTAELYQGYPFDRLRRRLGLEPDDPASIDAGDLACAGEKDLEQLDVLALDDVRLADAYQSALALRDDARAALFGAALVDRDPPSLAGMAIIPLFATLVREAMRLNDPEKALRWLERARTLQGGRERQTFEIWTAEIQARSGQPDAAVQTYESLLTDAPADAALALDAAETLFENGYPAHARPFLQRAHESGNPAVEDKAQALLDQLS